jgi:hypothetical protein
MNYLNYNLKLMPSKTILLYTLNRTVTKLRNSYWLRSLYASTLMTV